VNADTRHEPIVAIPIRVSALRLRQRIWASTNLLLNGTELQVQADGSVRTIQGQQVKAGAFPLPPTTVTFLTMPTAQHTE
jgi:hypothetical protein